MFTIQLDFGNLLNKPKILAAAKKAADDAARGMAGMAHSEAVRMAHEKLHTRREIYVTALHLDLDGECPVVFLEKKANWIEDGSPAHDHLPILLKSPKAKRSADGSMYVVVPFKHGPKGPTQMTPAQATLLGTIKKELKDRALPYSKLEMNGQTGLPKIGVLHRFNVHQGPIKTHEGPGMGVGPVGQVRQGHTGIPFTHGVQISQRAVEDKSGATRVVKDITTFRIASSKQLGRGMWHMPAVDGVKIFPEIERYTDKQWHDVFVPKLAELIGKML